jgi:hypothetical protein
MFRALLCGFVVATSLCIASGATSSSCLNEFNAGFRTAKTDGDRCDIALKYETCLSDVQNGLTDAAIEEIASTRSSNGCKIVMLQPMIKSRNNGTSINMELSVDGNADVILTRTSRESLSLTDLADRVGSVEVSMNDATTSIDNEINRLESSVIKSVQSTMSEFATKFTEGVNAADEAASSVSGELEGFKETIAGILDDFKTEQTKQVKDDVDTATTASKKVTDEVKVQVAGANEKLAKVQDCGKDGKAVDGTKCVPSTIVFAEGNGKCDVSNRGRTRYSKAKSGLELCTETGWQSVGGSEPCTAKYGEAPCNPATSCRALGLMGLVPKNGKVFYIGTEEYASKWTCKKDKHWGYGDDQKMYGGISYGDGSDGDITISASTSINALFRGYNPRQHRIPQWNNVVIKRNVILTVAPYDDAGDGGGILAFRVKGRLTMESGSQVNTDHKGWRGGLAAAWKPPAGTTMEPTYYSSESRSADGTGEGAGLGGRGGYGCCHGSGGSGASFGRKGQNGEPDKCRNSRGGWNQGNDHDQTYAPPGPEYNFKSSLYHPNEVMGSGGGAGGAGHPGGSNSAAQNGGNGGGCITIMAKAMTMSGKLYARGECGLPCRNYQGWPNQNTQVGGGGGGSGGLIKVITSGGDSQGGYAIDGGRQSYNTNWCRRDHQRGGAGGKGRMVITKNAKEL